MTSLELTVMFVLGIILICGIARYNESNKLFWTLLTAYVLSFTVGTIAYNAFRGEKESQTMLNKACPTQGSIDMQSAICYSDNMYYLTPVKETSALVSKVSMPCYVEQLCTLSDVSGVTQGIYLHNLPNPPNQVEIVNDS